MNKQSQDNLDTLDPLTSIEPKKSGADPPPPEAKEDEGRWEQIPGRPKGIEKNKRTGLYRNNGAEVEIK